MTFPKDKSIVTVAQPNRVGQPEVKFRPDDFDTAVFDKGYELIHESAVPCPCRVEGTQGAKSTCKNCGGIGWVFINPVRTRMLLQSLNLNTQYKLWGQEQPGTVMITTRKETELGFMDRLTISDSLSQHKQVLFPLLRDTSLIALTIYPIISIIDLFLYESDTLPLKRLTPGIDYSFDYNVITLNDSYKTLSSPSMSVRYRHNVQYHVTEMMKDVRNTYIFDSTGKDLNSRFPLHAMGRRAHNVLDIENREGDRLLDNSYNL